MISADRLIMIKIWKNRYLRGKTGIYGVIFDFFMMEK